MFTGLVECVGRVKGQKVSPTKKSSALELDLKGAPFLSDLKEGDSLSVNGCCLTARAIKGAVVTFDVGSETLAVTNLGDLILGSEVNIEPAMKLSDRLGGHMVSGHIDALAPLVSFEKNSDGSILVVEVPKAFAKYVIEKGSICLDGVSLTINKLTDKTKNVRARIMIIPSTMKKTTFSGLPKTWRFNLEVDLVGKYLERLNFRG